MNIQDLEPIENLDTNEELNINEDIQCISDLIGYWIPNFTILTVTPTPRDAITSKKEYRQKDFDTVISR